MVPVIEITIILTNVEIIRVLPEIMIEKPVFIITEDKARAGLTKVPEPPLMGITNFRGL
jgi:hypothetical protein